MTKAQRSVLPSKVSPALPALPALPELPALSPCTIGRAATLALYDELALAPKPGLVTLADSGSHDDMDAHTFRRSLFALRSSFVRLAELGAAWAPFDDLRRCGIEAEAHMLAATGGVNTHRGAIFTLGLLCAAAGAVNATGESLCAHGLRQRLLGCWGKALAQHAIQGSDARPGARAAQRYGLRGAAAEAALGFPVFFECALPAWARGSTLTPAQQRLDTLFHVIAVLDDCNLAHRGGLDGLRYAQREAARFLDAGGAAAVSGIDRARAIGRAFVGRRLSPGGAADMLAAACWFDRLTRG